tara:strand:+ start:340 stop:849 length:510 start_codon:yes stop_codon:yes gene_type:complete
MSEANKDMIAVGRLAGPHGIKGHLKFFFYGEDPSLIDGAGPLFNKKGHAFNLTRDRKHKDFWLVRIDTIPDRTAAEALPKQELFINRDKLPELDDDEIYYEDLVGLMAIDTDNNEIGIIIGVHDFGAGTLLDIKINDSKKSFMLPYTNDYIVEMDDTTLTVQDYKQFML